MLTRCSLTLGRQKVLLSGLILRRETLADSVLAEQLLVSARRQAEALLASAREEADCLREKALSEARGQFWRQVDVMFEDWQLQRRQMWESITSTAQTLVTNALQQLLVEQPDASRIDALVRQLGIAQASDEVAVLYCHPDWLEPATEALRHARASWSLRVDPLLSQQTLSLRTEHGDFSLSWDALSSAVRP